MNAAGYITDQLQQQRKMRPAVTVLAISCLLCQTWGFLFDSTDNVEFTLRTRKLTEKLKNSYSLYSSAKEFDPDRMTYILIHGWNGGDYDGNWPQEMTEKLLKRFDANTIFVSWKAWATNPNYLSAKGKCKDVGKNLSDLIKRLERYKGASRSKIHLIGHSLGGQVAGFAGSNLQNPKVARITGLDTAGIGFNCLLDNNDCLDASDADFVDEIHTLVSALSKGHADFYPIPKDPMQVLLDTKLVGAHDLASEYFIKSLEAGQCAFKATECSSYKNLKDGKCRSNSKNRLGFYAQKPTSLPPNKYFIEIDINKPC